MQSLKKTFLFDAVSKICNPVKGGMMGMGGNLMGKAVSKVSGKDEKKEEEDVHEEHHKPKFVKHKRMVFKTKYWFLPSSKYKL